MKKGWQIKALGELCDVLDHKRKPITKCDRIAGEYPYYGATGVLGHVEGYIFDEPLVLVGEDGAKWESGANTAFAVKGKIWVNNHAHVLRPHRAEILDNWLINFLNHSDLTEFVSGLTVPKLNQGNLREIPIPLAPLAEQQRIVGILDEAFAGLATAKANAEKNLQNARALFESHLQSVFSQRGEGWVEKPFSELCDIKHGFAFKGEFFTNKGDYVVLTPGNYYESGGYRDRGEKQKYYAGEIPPDYIMKEGDMLVAMTEQAAGLLGSPLLVPESNKFLHNQRLGLVTAKPGVPWTNDFFFHIFNTQAVRKAIHASASGVKVRHTSPTKIGEVAVAFPTSLTEQKRIVLTLASLTEETQRLAAIYQRKLAALEALKKSLLHQAFSGEL
jgi:type I restriction enzyme, S subunit